MTGAVEDVKERNGHNIPYQGLRQPTEFGVLNCGNLLPMTLADCWCKDKKRILNLQMGKKIPDHKDRATCKSESKSEGNSDAETKVTQTVKAVGQQISRIGRVTVIECRMQTETHIGARKDRHSHLGLHIESPRILILLIDVVIGADLGIRCTQLQTCIGLKNRLLKPIVAPGHTKREVEKGMFLARGEGAAIAELQRLSGELLKVGLKRDETTDRDGIGQEVSTLEIHTPTGGLVRKIVRGWGTKLPIDVEIGIGENLRRGGLQGYKETQRKGQQANV